MKKKHPEHVNLERWLVSYADFITLLFAFFVVMYALSQADKAKYEAAAASIRNAFGGQPPDAMLEIGTGTGGHSLNQFETNSNPGGRILDLPAGRSNTAAETDPGLREVKELLEESISLDVGASDPMDQMRMEFDSRGLVVKLAIKDIFVPGQVEPQEDLKPLIDRIGKVLAKTDRLVRIEGFADSSESQVNGFPSDWELSAARASWVVRYLIQRHGISPERLSAAGYGKNHPISRENDPMSRASNRRIEIVILNNTYQKK